MPKNLEYAVVCSSNMNRSMEAHDVLKKNGYIVRSFGSGNQVKLPGSAPDKPNVYDFGTPYADIYKDLAAKDRNLYNQNGILHMLKRNMRIKECPERFQLCKDTFHIIFTCEERVYDQVVEELIRRDQCVYYDEPVHVINMDIQDNHEEATVGAFKLRKLAHSFDCCDDLDDEIDDILTKFEAEQNTKLLHCMAYQYPEFNT